MRPTENRQNPPDESKYEKLADQVHFQLSQRQEREFRRLLGAPIDEATIKLLVTPAPWERGS